MRNTLRLKHLALLCFVGCLWKLISLNREEETGGIGYDQDWKEEFIIDNHNRQNQVINNGQRNNGDIDNQNQQNENIGNHNQQNEYFVNENDLNNVDSHDTKSMSELVGEFLLGPEVHYMCEDVRRPNPGDIWWRHNTYQGAILKFEDFPETEAFMMKFYYDNRFESVTGEQHIRSIVTVRGPGPLISVAESRHVLEWAWAMNRVKWRVLLWYGGYRDPVGVDCKIQDASGFYPNVSNEYHFQQILTCILPRLGEALPVSASVVKDACGQPINNIEVVYPEKTPNSRRIGVCMASLFGNMGRENVTYFVNWMETLHRLGVTEVTINNGTLTFTDEVMRRAFQYYQDLGWLTFTHYPPINTHWDSPEEDASATVTTTKITTGDCIYRNIKRYWYVLIIDMDEIPVPVRFDTYQDFLSDYLDMNKNVTRAHCLAMQASYFYQDIVPPGNPEYGSHLPVLRHTNSLGVEPSGVEAKSFHNTKYLVAAGHHLTQGTHGGDKNLIRHYVEPTEMYTHHYRSDCEYTEKCRTHWNVTVRDDSLPRRYGPQLTDRIEEVLSHIGYSY